MDSYPSPYLSGEFDYLISNKKDHNYQAIIETNRGCPFLCTYCYWGRGGNTTKYRYHSLERVFAEIDWIGKNKISYVFKLELAFARLLFPVYQCVVVPNGWFFFSYRFFK